MSDDKKISDDKRNLNPTNLGADEIEKTKVKLDAEVFNKTNEKFYRSLKYLAAYLSQKNQISYQLAVAKGKIKSLEDKFEAPYKIDFLQEYATSDKGYDIGKITADPSIGKVFSDYFESTNHFQDPLQYVNLEKESIMPEDKIKKDTTAIVESEEIEVEKVTLEGSKLIISPVVAPEFDQTIFVKDAVIEPRQLNEKEHLSKEEFKILQVTLDEEALKKTDDRAVESLRYLAEQYSKINRNRYLLAKAQGNEASFQMPYDKNYLKNNYGDGEGGYWIEEILEDENNKRDEKDRIFTNHLKSMSPDFHNKLMSESSYITLDIKNENFDYYEGYQGMPVRPEGKSITSWIDCKIPKPGEPGLPPPNFEGLEGESSEPLLNSGIEKVTNEEHPSSQSGHKDSTGSIGGLDFTEEEEKDLAVSKGHTRAESMDSVTDSKPKSTTLEDQIKFFSNQKVEKEKLQSQVKAIVDYIENKAINNKFTTQGKVVGTSTFSICIKGEEHKNIPKGISEIHNRLAPLKDGPCGVEEMQNALTFAKEQSENRAHKKEGPLVFWWNARSQDTINDYERISKMGLS
ncbi:hypothetical protein [Piscirickettsia salmonis]|uniref:hypothetical protein n=1 Tax=Piscirickettsia salmonis TaxID=1238 RepID=UPI0007C8ED44|nr:hypothetical protein A0O36_02504 [Piscirickettsiaceae bacterium NZ-RLO1]